MKSIPEHELKAEEVHRMLLDTLQPAGQGCAEGSSLEAVCRDQASGLDGNQTPVLTVHTPHLPIS